MRSQMINNFVGRMTAPQSQFAPMRQFSPAPLIAQMQQNGLSPQQAYNQLMQDPNFVQSVNMARQKYPNQSFVDIARLNGYDTSKR